jgi:hypothetical protein
MVRLALLGESYPAQLRENPQALREVEVVWAGTSVEAFQEEVPRQRPEVLALDFVELGPEHLRRVAALLERTGARHAIVTYRFTRRRALQHAPPPGKVRLMQGPISLALLRAHVNLALVDDLLESKGEGASTGAGVPAEPRPPRYTSEQLGRLLEVSTGVQCECPNHLSRLVSGLQAFEAYVQGCENRSEADRQVHALLHRYTASARGMMEEALTELVRHERIPL